MHGDTVTGQGVINNEEKTNTGAGTVVDEIERALYAPVTAKPSAAMCVPSVIAIASLVTTRRP